MCYRPQSRSSQKPRGEWQNPVHADANMRKQNEKELKGQVSAETFTGTHLLCYTTLTLGSAGSAQRDIQPGRLEEQ